MVVKKVKKKYLNLVIILILLLFFSGCLGSIDKQAMTTLNDEIDLNAAEGEMAFKSSSTYESENESSVREVHEYETRPIILIRWIFAIALLFVCGKGLQWGYCYIDSKIKELKRK